MEDNLQKILIIKKKIIYTNNKTIMNIGRDFFRQMFFMLSLIMLLLFMIIISYLLVNYVEKDKIEYINNMMQFISTVYILTLLVLFIIYFSYKLIPGIMIPLDGLGKSFS